MRKFFISLFAAVFSISLVSSQVFAIDTSSWITVQNNTQLEKTLPTQSGSTTIQPRGIKSWIIKKGMEAVAYALRYSMPSVSSFLIKIWAPSNIITEIRNKASVIAGTLEKIAINFNYVSSTVKTTVYQQLQAQWFSQQVSYWVAQIIDFVTF